MLLIGLGHKARHGKDTFADAVKGAYPELDIRLHSFADPLREEIRNAARQVWREVHPRAEFQPQKALKLLCNLHNLPFEKNAPVDKDYPWGKQRVLHQWWGTEFRRAQDPFYWVNRAMQLVTKARNEEAHAVIFRDMRFINEYDLIGQQGGWRIKVSRLGYVSNVPPHISETELDGKPFDLHLGVGDGNLLLLKDLSVLMFRHLLSGVKPAFVCG